MPAPTTCQPPAHTHLTTFPGGSFCTNCGHVSPPAGPGAPYRWWETPTGYPGTANRDTLALVLHWMAEQDYTARDVAYAVEKPWKFTDEFRAACAPVPAEDPAR